jgi:hypothetical protein
VIAWCVVVEDVVATKVQSCFGFHYAAHGFIANGVQLTDCLLPGDQAVGAVQALSVYAMEAADFARDVLDSHDAVAGRYHCAMVQARFVQDVSRLANDLNSTDLLSTLEFFSH